MIVTNTILLVEDNADDEAMALWAMNKIVNDIVVAHDGAEALDYIFGTGKYAGRDVCQVPQLVLMDLNMPKVGGLEVLRRIRSDQRTCLLPVVILTSSDEEQDLVESYKLGANSFIRKPVEFDQFVEAVHQLGLYWLVLNEIPGKELRV